MRRLVVPRLLSVLGVLSVLNLTACAQRPTSPGNAPEANSDSAVRAACRQRADEVYNRQNRAEIYRPATQTNTPYSANYQAGSTDRGLSQLFSHETMIRDCVRNTGIAPGPVPEAPAAR